MKKAFTLIELLVTIGILAIVAAGVVALINPLEKTRQASDTTVMNDIGQIATGAQAYAAQNNLYPINQAAFVPSEIQNMPKPPSGYGASYPVVYDNPNGASFVVSGSIKSTKYTGIYCTGAGCGAACIYKWTSAAGPCYSCNTNNTCP